ncbi:MAG: CNNM domain-containing protein [Halarcobacter sp.]
MLMLLYFSIAIGISFLCSILEAVILSINQSHIELIKQEKPKLGSLMYKQKRKIDYSIGAILTLNTFAHTLGAAGVGAEAAKAFGEQYMFFVSAILTLLILFFSEIIPKTIGALYWKSLSEFTTRVIEFLVFITYPLLFIMNKVTALFKSNKHETISKDEINALVNIAKNHGVLKEREKKFIGNILSLGDLRVKDIYTPRSVMFAIKKEDLINSFLQKDKSFDLEKLKVYSRIPIYDKNIDDIVGIIISKEFFYETIENNLENKEDIINEVNSINENIRVPKLIDMFISKNEHIYIVEDNYGQTKGIVTLEDALEAILGIEIVDELDQNIDMRELAKEKMKLHRARS